MLFFYLSLRAFIILNTSLYGTVSPMDFPAAKGTSKVGTTSIAGVGEKEYPTVPAPFQTLS
ncbi:MAG: hypothetical protein JRJ73_14295 [Deltaproteobacteria bacterium]|nr:hypothetical protein [Deltaproteobacteria bacterium]